MRIVSIVGARPQFVKLAPVCRALSAHNANGAEPIEDFILHTGQHYDPGMSAIFFDELGIPPPSVDLGVGSGSHGAQTARMLEGIESVLIERRPDAVVVYGDTNSTLAGALAAAKLDIGLAHVEAGLRSFNRRMPEELNRVATDHISDLLFAPTATAVENLRMESLADRALLTGDVMYDALLFTRRRALEHSRILESLRIQPLQYGVVTLHRAENTEAAQLRTILSTLNRVAERYLPLVFPVHPRTAQLLRTDLSAWTPASALHVVDPVGYLDMVRLVDGARLAITDSGGLQKEAFFLGCPCVTVRTETEWPETVTAGGNQVVGTGADALVRAVEGWLEQGARPAFVGPSGGQPFGDGNAARNIVSGLVAWAGTRN
jgi:UDP-GlcNAc3NAcA epimerase